jgi:N-acetylmuramate 1-kinase
MTTGWTRALDEAGVVRLAELLALKLRSGDVVALSGELGAGKTTFARALIGALLPGDAPEVPSPTFSLQQSYVTPRMTIAHFDFYRLSGAEEARELGFEEAAQEGAVVVEWPERAPGLLPESRFEIALVETADPGTRQVTVRGLGAAAARAQRIGEVMAFLGGQADWTGARVIYLQGDASTRGYARLAKGDRTALLMDAPRQPDGPPIRHGKPYSQIAHLAEDMVRAFSGIGTSLRAAGLSVPEILAEDLSKGLMLVEDLGDTLYSASVAAGALPQEELWRGAVDALLALRKVPAPERLPLRDGGAHQLPTYDRGALEIEVELLVDWYWPACSISRTRSGAPPPTTSSRCCRMRASIRPRRWRRRSSRTTALLPGRPTPASTRRNSPLPTMRWAPSATPRSSAFSCAWRGATASHNISRICRESGGIWSAICAMSRYRRSPHGTGGTFRPPRATGNSPPERGRAWNGGRKWPARSRPPWC